ncbi:hypothetical protein MAC3UK_0005 [Bdellovibrio phage MAC3UK]|nr:hypothetical protein MAC3UK_0005 [Bdellovibrio phage MAC3UK]
MSQAEKKDLEDRLRVVIQGTCNTIGCKNCDLKWPEGCSATDLQNKIMDIEHEEFKAHEKR